MTDDPRPLLLEICHLLAQREFTTATGGNASVRLPDGCCWVTPGGMHKARLRMDDLVLVDADGTVCGGRRAPSSETAMHLAVYRALPRAGAVIHAHPPCATGFAQAGMTLDTSSSSEAIAVLGPAVPLIPYAPPSSPALEALVGRTVRATEKAYVMAHHGVLTWGVDAWEAYDLLDTMELFARALLASQALGGGVPLPDEEIARLAAKHRELMG